MGPWPSFMLHNVPDNVNCHLEEKVSLKIGYVFVGIASIVYVNTELRSEVLKMRRQNTGAVFVI